jgi:hypothetical protein
MLSVRTVRRRCTPVKNRGRAHRSRPAEATDRCRNWTSARGARS